MKQLATDWFCRAVLPEDWTEMRTWPLLYLHNLMQGLERRLIGAIGEKHWDKYFYSFRKLRAYADDAGVGQSFRNYEILYGIVVEADLREIAALTGRAA